MAAKITNCLFSLLDKTEERIHICLAALASEWPLNITIINFGHCREAIIDL